MNAIIAIQDLIKTNEERIKKLKAQLDDHDSGRAKLSIMSYASAENALENSKLSLEKNKVIYDELAKCDIQEHEKEQRIKEAIIRKNYYKYQKVRIKRNGSKENNQRLEAMMIVDELPSDINLDDEDIFEIASAIIKLDLRVHDELDTQLSEIKKKFEELLSNIDNENIDKLGLLQTHIPIVVLHLVVLKTNIEDTIKEKTLPEFKGLPKFEDWWIDELWLNHQAYFGLYKWKAIVSSLCITSEQKQAWESIFSNWVFIKKVLNKKGSLAFDFNLAFDTLVREYTTLEEELNINNLKSMETIVQNITKKEDFHSFKYEHTITTPYFEFKKKKLDYNDKEQV
ncbi:MAG: hypothetical protein U9R39_00525 [Campylobacterota bacterium]|nr:hypothetical protein [Campylobacterota bacterium]